MNSVEIPTGVSETALFTAWQRHHESARPDALFIDPVATHLFAYLSDTPMHEKIEALSRMTKFPQYFVVRTRYFDDHIRAALRTGIRQVVTLGAGIDGRPVRLPCPTGTRWYELDLEGIMTFKRALLKSAGVLVGDHWTPIAADITRDWVQPLLDAGFSPDQPTVWLIEGLLMYLTDDEGQILLDLVSRHSSDGSVLLLEHLQARMLEEEGAWHRARVESQGAVWLSARDDMREWLTHHGWLAAVQAGNDEAISHGRPVDELPASWLAHAQRRP